MFVGTGIVVGVTLTAVGGHQPCIGSGNSHRGVWSKQGGRIIHVGSGVIVSVTVIDGNGLHIAICGQGVPAAQEIGTHDGLGNGGVILGQINRWGQQCGFVNGHAIVQNLSV